MPITRLANFKGLAQHILFEELSPEYCHTLSNLDVDNPVGRLTKRGGYTKKYADAFTDIISAYEYKYPTSGDTILLFNDNGTLKYYTNGGSLASLSLPSGATLESNFRNQYFGWKDRIIITTGNGSTNYVLGFYYLKRVNADNTGLFGNVEEFTGYKLLKSQLIPPHGVFSRIYNIIKVGNYYYISFQNSKWIEKRDSNFRLVERILAHKNAADYTTIALETDGTMIFLGTEDGIYRINPNGWIILNSNTTYGNIKGMQYDSEGYVYAITGGLATDKLIRFVASTLAHEFSANIAGIGIDIGIDENDKLTGYAYALVNDSGTKIRRYGKNNFGYVNENSATAGLTHVFGDFGNSGYLWATSPTAGAVNTYAADLTMMSSYNNVREPRTILLIGTNIRIVSDQDGTIENPTNTDVIYPDFFSLNVESINGGGSLNAGTYFYKISIVDSDGQEFTLSDPVIVSFAAVSDIDIHIIANISQLDDYYRVKYINVYRAYNSTEEAQSPSTNYKLLKTIDINDTNWVKDATIGIYYYDFTDSTIDANMGSVTFQENSGFSENTKPRYVNYKVNEWINNQLHCANFYVDGDTYKSKIVKSQIEGPDVVPFANTYDFDAYDGDEIKNITTAYSRAYIMKNRRTGIFYNDIVERVLEQGIADIDAYYTDTDVIYLFSDKGIFVVKGANIIRINDPVKTSFNSISSFTDATVFLRDDKERLFFAVPEDIVLVWNRKFNVWTTYDANYAFRGYYKNLANEYIGFGKGAGETNHYFYYLNDGGYDEATQISIDYESPLLKFAEYDGEDIELIKMQYRVDKIGALNIVLYDFAEASKRIIETINLLGPLSSDLAVMTKYLSDAWGEAFSIGISGTCAKFRFSSLSLFGEPAGETVNV